MRLFIGFMPWLYWLLLVSMVLSLGVAELVPLVTSTGNTLVQQLNPQQVGGTSPGNLRVLTANLWHDYPLHRDLEARWEYLATAIRSEQVDIACLQEVPSTGTISNRAWWLGEELGAAYVYGRANGNQHVLGFEEGVAIISRHPLRDPRLVEIQPQASPFEHRAVLRAIAETPAGDIAIYCAHLTIGRQTGAAQIAWLYDFIERDSDGMTAIIAGDFNAGESSPPMRELALAWTDTYRAANPTSSSLTFSLDLPLVGPVFSARYDYIFHRPGETDLHVEASHILFSGSPRISDHFAVLTRFRAPRPLIPSTGHNGG